MSSIILRSPVALSPSFALSGPVTLSGPVALGGMIVPAANGDTMGNWRFLAPSVSLGNRIYLERGFLSNF